MLTSVLGWQEGLRAGEARCLHIYKPTNPRAQESRGLPVSYIREDGWGLDPTTFQCSVQGPKELSRIGLLHQTECLSPRKKTPVSKVRWPRDRETLFLFPSQL